MKDQNNNVMTGVQVVWKSSNPQIATVSTGGLVTAIGNGTASITASSASVTDTVQVIVAIPAILTGIVITPAEPDTLTRLGQTVQLTATVRDRDGNAMTGVAVTWKSGNPQVATVTAAGLVTAAGNGTAAVIATAGAVTDTVRVNVALPTGTPASIVITPAEPDTLTSANLTVQLAATVKDQNKNVITGVSVTWKSGNPQVATVTAAGLVIPASNGTATVIATAGAVADTVRVNVNVALPPGALVSILITPAEPETLTEIGQTLQLTVTARDEDGNILLGLRGVWESTDPRIVTVSQTGLVTAVDYGSASVTFLTEFIEARPVRVNVALPPAKPASIVITPAEPDTLAVGQTLRLTATVRDQYNNAMVVDSLTWISSDTKVATVDASGRVTAVDHGMTEISARVGDLLEAIPVIVTGSLFDDREVLTLFYHLTGGPNWTNDTNWLSEEPLREWYGVETRNTGRVVELSLDENNLSGVIPADLARLTGLEDLRLRNNGALSGALPGELIDLRLGTLRLGGTGVCAPPDAAIQAWLRSIPDRQVADCFTVDPGRSAAYLVQATQSFSHPVPLVAGERAALRVFPVAGTDDTEMAMPPVRATFYLDDAEVHVVDVPGGDAIVPPRIDEGSLATSVNREIPGNVIQPGLEMVVEIDPDSTATTASGASVRLPETGRMAVDVKDVPPLDLTLVPLLWEENPDRSVLTELEGETADSWRFRAINNMLPVAEFRLTVREHVLTEVEPVFANAGDLLGVITMLRATDGASGHYMGYLMSDGGIANQPGYISLAKFIPNIMTHELGHNMNLGHAPCNIDDPGYYYPYPDGSTGSWGYDMNDARFTDELLVPPDVSDIMSYCFGNNWIGAYHFARALNYRHYHEGLPALAGSPSARSLLVWGGVDEHGDLFLEPAFLLNAPPSPLEASGPYRLAGEDAAGAGLFSLSFGMPEVEGDGYEGGGAFAFVLPVRRDWHRKLARVTISGPEGVAELDRDGDRFSALLVDRVTGRVRGYLKDWPAPGASGAGSANARRVLPEPGLDVLISRGLPGPTSRER